MTLAAVAPTCGDLHRAHLEGLQQTLLRCLHFVSYSFSSKSLGATSAVNLSAAPFFLSHLFKIPTNQLYRFTTSCKTTRRVVCPLVLQKTNTTCLLCSGRIPDPIRSCSLQNRRYLFAFFAGNEAGMKRQSRAPIITGSMSNSQIKLCVA